VWFLVRRVSLVTPGRCATLLFVSVSLQVPVESTSVTKPFEVKRLEGEGMPVHNFPSQKGVLHVKMEVDFPASLTAEQKELVGKLFSS
jgi:DnaJ-class molecular chaperone